MVEKKKTVKKAVKPVLKKEVKTVQVKQEKTVKTASPKQRDYSGTLMDSFKLVKSNLTLLLPDVLFSLIALAILGGMLKLVGLYSFVVENFGLTGEALKTALQTYLTNIQINPFMISTILLALLLIAILKVFADCTVYGMIASVLKGGKVDFVAGLKNSKSFFWRYLGVAILGLIPVAILFTVMFTIILSWPIGTIVGLLLLILFVFLILVFTFLLPVLFLDNKGVKETFSRSYNFFMNNKWHVIKLILIMFLFSTLIGVVLDSIGKVVASIAILLGIYEVIRLLLSLFVEVWLNVFLFKNY